MPIFVRVFKAKVSPSKFAETYPQVIFNMLYLYMLINLSLIMSQYRKLT